MATKVSLKDGSRHLGQVTIFDADPSFDLLKLAFPDARSIVHNFKTDQWTIDVGESLVIAYAD
jgi:hypothetical protein